MVSWLPVGLGVSATIGREGSGIMAASGAGGVSLLAEREVVSCQWGWRCTTSLSASGITHCQWAGGVSLLAERDSGIMAASDTGGVSLSGRE